MSTLHQSISHLGWDALNHLLEAKKSATGMIVSPLSITIALAMLAGAAGAEQKSKLCSKMGVKDPSNLNANFGEVLGSLQANQGSLLEVANGVFLRGGIAPKQEYLEFLKAFTAELQSYPDLEAAREEINKWIFIHTKDLIKDMISRGMLKQAEVVVVNAVAFKGLWETPFDTTHTDPEYIFRIDVQTTKRVSMMNAYGKKFEVSDHKDFTVLRLPYQQQSGTPLVYFQAYLPNEGKSLKDALPSIREAKQHFVLTHFFSVGLPRFESDTSNDITGLLETLGYPLHGGWPELSVAGSGPPADLVIHKAIIKVDEEGTVAAAATVIVARRSRPVSQRKIVFDRPFAYTIVDENGLVYFTGIFS